MCTYIYVQKPILAIYIYARTHKYEAETASAPIIMSHMRMIRIPAMQPDILMR